MHAKYWEIIETLHQPMNGLENAPSWKLKFDSLVIQYSALLIPQIHLTLFFQV